MGGGEGMAKVREIERQNLSELIVRTRNSNQIPIGQDG
jgi:hypothetical protein